MVSDNPLQPHAASAVRFRERRRDRCLTQVRVIKEACVVWLNRVKEWLDILVPAVVVIGGCASVWRYQWNSARERAHWLFELHQRFHQEPRFRGMRARVESRAAPFPERDLTRLDDYLNFFELIAWLVKRRELKVDEVLALFSYPLRMIAKNPEVLAHLRQYDYETLEALLRRLRYTA